MPRSAAWSARRLQIDLPHQVAHDAVLPPRNKLHPVTPATMEGKSEQIEGYDCRLVKRERREEGNLVVAVELDEAMHEDDMQAAIGESHGTVRNNQDFRVR